MGLPCKWMCPSGHWCSCTGKAFSPEMGSRCNHHQLGIRIVAIQFEKNVFSPTGFQSICFGAPLKFKVVSKINWNNKLVWNDGQFMETSHVVDLCGFVHASFFLKTFAVRSARGWGQTTIGLTVWFISSLRVSQFGSRNPLTTADQMPGHHTSVGCDFKTGPGALVSDWICPVSHCSGLDSHHLNQVLGLCLTVFAPQVPMHAATSDHLYIL